MRTEYFPFFIVVFPLNLLTLSYLDIVIIIYCAKPLNILRHISQGVRNKFIYVLGSSEGAYS